MLRGRGLRLGLLLSRRRRCLLPRRRRRLLWTGLRLNLLLTLRRWGRGRLVLSRRRRLLRARLRLNLLLLRRWSCRRLVLSRWRRLLRTRLRLNLLLTLRRRSRGRRLVLSWRWRLLRTRLRLHLLLTLRRRSRGRLVLGWRRRLLRTRLWLHLWLLGRRRYGPGGRLISGRLVAIRRYVWRGRRCYCTSNGRLITIGLLLNWSGSRRWLRARPAGGRLVAIRLDILLGRVRLPSCIGLLSRVWLLRCVRLRAWWSRSRGRSWTRRNYRGDGFALRDWLGGCNDGWLPMVDGGELLAILRGLFAMLTLGGHRWNALLACGG